MKAWWRLHRPTILSGFMYGIVRFVGMTLRIHAEGFEKSEGLSTGRIICGWHGRTLLASAKFRNLGFWAIISHSRDGDVQNHIYQKLGFRTIRGSTGRGGERVLVESIRILRKGETMAITPDGPRGPREVVQMGVVMMAKKSGAALIPGGGYARPGIVIKTWDRFLIPLPFAKAVALLGDPIYVPADADDSLMEAKRAELQLRMTELQAESEKRLGVKPQQPFL